MNGNTWVFLRIRQFLEKPIVLRNPVSIVLASLLLTATLANSSYGFLRPIGFAAMVLLTVGCMISLLNRLVFKLRVRRLIVGILFLFPLLILVYLIGIFSIGSATQGLRTTGQLILLASFFIVMSLMAWSDARIITLSILLTGYAILMMLWWGAAGIPSPFGAYYDNPNALGMYLFYCLFFLIAASHLSSGGMKKFIFISIMAVVILGVIAARYRMFIVAGAGALVTFYLWPFLRRQKYLAHLYLAGIILGIFCFIYIYSRLSTDPVFINLNSFVHDFTGKDLFSGRQKIWPYILDAIKVRPWTGYGSGALPADVFPPRYFYASNSAHSIYLQITLQSGLIGLLLFLLLLSSIWGVLRKGGNEFVVRLTAGYFIAIVIEQAFEVSMTQNSFAIGLMQWLILAVGVSRSLRPIRPSGNPAAGVGIGI